MSEPQVQIITPTSLCLGIFLGDFSDQATRLIAKVPQDALYGPQIRAAHILASETLPPGSDHWGLQLGRQVTGLFQAATKTFSLSGGIVKDVTVTIPYTDPVLFSRGDLIAVRLIPYGAPAPLVGLSFVPEWGTLSSNRASRN